jgi:hypothetical protein
MVQSESSQTAMCYTGHNPSAGSFDMNLAGQSSRILWHKPPVAARLWQHVVPTDGVHRMPVIAPTPVPVR